MYVGASSRVDMSVRMLLQGIIVWQVYGADVLFGLADVKEFVRSSDACQRTGKARISNPERSCGWAGKELFDLSQWMPKYWEISKSSLTFSISSICACLSGLTWSGCISWPDWPLGLPLDCEGCLQLKTKEEWILWPQSRCFDCIDHLVGLLLTEASLQTWFFINPTDRRKPFLVSDLYPISFPPKPKQPKGVSRILSSSLSLSVNFILLGFFSFWAHCLNVVRIASVWSMAFFLSRNSY